MKKPSFVTSSLRTFCALASIAALSSACATTVGNEEPTTSGSDELKKLPDFTVTLPTPKPAWQRYCTDGGAPSSYVVHTESGQCGSLYATSGHWAGREAFEGVSTGVCRYSWVGDQPWLLPAFATLEGVAKVELDANRWGFPESRTQVAPDCSPANPILKAPGIDDTLDGFVEEVQISKPCPLVQHCPACKATVRDGKAYVVLSPEAARIKQLWLSHKTAAGACLASQSFAPQGNQLSVVPLNPAILTYAPTILSID